MIINFDDTYVDMSRLDAITFGEGYISIVWKKGKDLDEAVFSDAFGNSIITKWLESTKEGRDMVWEIEGDFRDAVTLGAVMFDFNEAFRALLKRTGWEFLKESYEAFKKDRGII